MCWLLPFFCWPCRCLTHPRPHLHQNYEFQKSKKSHHHRSVPTGQVSSFFFRFGMNVEADCFVSVFRLKQNYHIESSISTVWRVQNSGEALTRLYIHIYIYIYICVLFINMVLCILAGYSSHPQVSEPSTLVPPHSGQHLAPKHMREVRPVPLAFRLLEGNLWRFKSSLEVQSPSLKLTANAPEKWMVGIYTSFLFGRPIFRGFCC